MVTLARRSTRSSTRKAFPSPVKKAPPPSSSSPSSSSSSSASEDGREDSDFEEKTSSGLRRRSKRLRTPKATAGGRKSPGSSNAKKKKRTPNPTTPTTPATTKRVTAPSPVSADDDDENASDAEPVNGFVTRNMAASTAKRCCALDNEGKVDLCVKLLAQACGLDASSAHLLGETKSYRGGKEEDDDKEEEEGEIYAEFGKSLSERFSEEGNSSGLTDARTILYVKTSTAKSRSLESNFIHFWNQLVVLMHGKETLYVQGGEGGGDEVDFLACMSQVCMELSKSAVRQVRYAACVCGYALLGSLVQAHQILDESNVVLTKQLRAVGHSSTKKDQRRDLNRRLQECHERSNSLDVHMKELFQELVIVRFRDVSPQIRSLTVRWVGVWVVQHPKKFLSDAYLKYVAWSLNDKDPQGRLAAVQALNQVYQRHAIASQGGGSGRDGGADVSNFSNLSALDLLTQRFSGRFVELIKDVNEQVCVNAMELVLSLSQANLLDVCDEDGECGGLSSDLAMLLLDSNMRIRKSAGKLAACVIERRLGEATKESSKSRSSTGSKKGKRKGAGDSADDALPSCVEACKLLSSLVQEGMPSLSKVLQRRGRSGLTAEGEMDEEDYYVRAVSAVVPHLPVLHEWEVLAKACKSKHLKGDAGVLSVVRVVLASMQRFTDPKLAREFLLMKKEKGKKVMASAVTDFCERTTQQSTMALMGVLSTLFSQCKSKKGPNAVSLLYDLCQVVTLMQQELYVATGKVDDFKKIVDVLEELWTRDSLLPPSGKPDASKESRRSHLVFIARCLLALESRGPGATREIAGRAVTDMVNDLKETVASGLDKLPEDKVVVALEKIHALMNKLKEDASQKEKFKGLIQEYLELDAKMQTDEEEAGSDAMDEDEEESESAEGESDDEESGGEAPPPPPRSRRRL